MGTHRKLVWDVLATAAARTGALLTGFVLTGAAAGAAWGVQDVLLTRVAAVGVLTIEGSVAGVRAGAPAVPLRLTLRNPGAQPSSVTRVTTTVLGVTGGPASCAAGHLRVVDWVGVTVVAPGGATTITVPVAVGPGLPAGCHDVTWRLGYAAS